MVLNVNMFSDARIVLYLEKFCSSFVIKNKTNIFYPTKQTVMIMVTIFTVKKNKNKNKIKSNVNNENKWFRFRLMLMKLSVNN